MSIEKNEERKKQAEKQRSQWTAELETSPLIVSWPLSAYSDGPVPSLSSLKARIANTGALPEGT